MEPVPTSASKDAAAEYAAAYAASYSANSTLEEIPEGDFHAEIPAGGFSADTAASASFASASAAAAACWTDDEDEDEAVLPTEGQPAKWNALLAESLEIQRALLAALPLHDDNASWQVYSLCESIHI